MHSSTSSARKTAPRDVTRFDELSEQVQRWTVGEAIYGDVWNAVCAAIIRDPRPETVTATTAALPRRLRDDVIEHLASLRGASAGELFDLHSLCGDEGSPRPTPVADKAALISAVERWFDPT